MDGGRQEWGRGGGSWSLRLRGREEQRERGGREIKEEGKEDRGGQNFLLDITWFLGSYTSEGGCAELVSASMKFPCVY